MVACSSCLVDRTLLLHLATRCCCRACRPGPILLLRLHLLLHSLRFLRMRGPL
jgi:hypothetical protein